MKRINLFNYIVHRFGFLKHVPLLPLLFDLHLKVFTGLTNASILHSIEAIESEVLKWPGVYSSTHKYGGLQFNFAGKEIGHIHGNGLLDIPFSRMLKEEMMTHNRITDHHTFKNSGWISFYIKNQTDAAYAIDLLLRSYLRLTQRANPATYLAIFST